MNFSLFLQSVINGLAVGSVYAIFALGYTLVFSILGIINFAHSAVFTLGAYFTYMLMGGAIHAGGLLANFSLGGGLPFIPALIGAAALAGLAAVVIERLAFRPLRTRGADPLLMLVSSLGVAILIVNVIQLLVGTDPYALPGNAYGDLPPAVNFGTAASPIPVLTVRIILFVVSAVILAFLWFFISRTRTGKALRAVAEDPITASLLGINTDRLIMLTFFLSGFLGGIAGTLIGASTSITGPYFGITFGLKGLAVIVLGGLGNIPGAVLGGLVIGLGEAFLPAQFASGYKDAVAFALLFIVLLIRPQGLLGWTTAQKV